MWEHVCVYRSMCVCGCGLTMGVHMCVCVCVHFGAETYLCGNHKFNPASIKRIYHIKVNERLFLITPFRDTWRPVVFQCVYVQLFRWTLKSGSSRFFLWVTISPVFFPSHWEQFQGHLLQLVSLSLSFSQLFQLSSKVQVFVNLFAFFYFHSVIHQNDNFYENGESFYLVNYYLVCIFGRYLVIPFNLKISENFQLLLLLLFTPLEFFASVIANGFSLESEW